MDSLTKRDREQAVLLAEIMGQIDVGGGTCLPPHDCPSCSCAIQCVHSDEWECVAAAIGASRNAVNLWLGVSNAIGMSLRDYDYDWERDIIIKWRDQHGVPRDGLPDDDDLEAARLISEGAMPPWMGYRGSCLPP